MEDTAIYETSSTALFSQWMYCPRVWYLGLHTCYHPNKLPDNVMQGWQCPVCKKVYVPWITMCSDPHLIVTTGNTTEQPGTPDG